MLLIWSFIGVASYSGLGGADISFRRLHIVNKAQIFGFWRIFFVFEDKYLDFEDKYLEFEEKHLKQKL